jgi:hypothetical protein
MSVSGYVCVYRHGDATPRTTTTRIIYTECARRIFRMTRLGCNRYRQTDFDVHIHTCVWGGLHTHAVLYIGV